MLLADFSDSPDVQGMHLSDSYAPDFYARLGWVRAIGVQLTDRQAVRRGRRYRSRRAFRWPRLQRSRESGDDSFCPSRSLAVDSDTLSISR